MLKFAGPLAALSALAFAPSPALATDVETQLRCSVPGDASIYAREAGAIPALKRGVAVVSRTGQPVPPLMVDGWHPASGPLGVVLSDLGREAGFAVTGAEGLGTVSWTRASAPLSQVLDNLTSQVGASWSFSSGVVHVIKAPIASTIPVSMALPQNRDVTLALMDTLRGYDASGVTLSASGISFASAPAGLSRIEGGISGISEIFAFDVSFSQGRPSAGRYSWSSIGGASLVADGAGGRMLLGEDAPAKLASFLAAAGDVRVGGSQTVAGPSGWSLVVPQSQCGAGSAEVTLRPKRVGDGFSLQVAGLGGPIDVPMVTLGQTLVIASKDPVGGWINIVSIRPRILSVR